MEKNEPLKVWLLTCFPDGVTVNNRIFAELGDTEILRIARDIADAFDGFGLAISAYVESEIRKQLANGATEIHISADDNQCSEYIIVKTEIDSGRSFDGFEDCKVVKKCCKEVHKGDKVFVTIGYEGDAQGIYSAKMPEMREYELITVE